MAEIGDQVGVPLVKLVFIEEVPERVQVGIVRAGQSPAVIEGDAVAFA